MSHHVPGGVTFSLAREVLISEELYLARSQGLIISNLINDQLVDWGS
jgi:hypothetical protein